MDRNKHDFSKRPKYNSTYIKDLHRKVLFKDRIYLVDLTLKDPKKVGGGHVPRPFVEGSDDYNMMTDLSIILGNKDLKTRFIEMVYKQLTSEGIVSLILRKLLTSSNLTWKELREYTNKICARFASVFGKHNQSGQSNHSCPKINDSLLKNLLNLLPFKFEPKTILDIGGNYETKGILSDHFKDAKVDIDFDKTQYDLVICNQYLHHVNDKKEIASRISDLVKPDGFLFVRDSDVESDDDQLLLDIMHDIYDYITLDSGVYKHQKLNYLIKENVTELFPKLQFHSESHVKYDLTNPIKAFNILLKK